MQKEARSAREEKEEAKYVYQKYIDHSAISYSREQEVFQILQQISIPNVLHIATTFGLNKYITPRVISLPLYEQLAAPGDRKN